MKPYLPDQIKVSRTLFIHGLYALGRALQNTVYCSRAVRKPAREYTTGLRSDIKEALATLPACYRRRAASMILEGCKIEKAINRPQR